MTVENIRLYTAAAVATWVSPLSNPIIFYFTINSFKIYVKKKIKWAMGEKVNTRGPRITLQISTASLSVSGTSTIRLTKTQLRQCSLSVAAILKTVSTLLPKGILLRIFINFYFLALALVQLSHQLVSGSIISHLGPTSQFHASTYDKLSTRLTLNSILFLLEFCCSASENVSIYKLCFILAPFFLALVKRFLASWALSQIDK